MLRANTFSPPTTSIPWSLLDVAAAERVKLKRLYGLGTANAPQADAQGTCCEPLHLSVRSS